MKYEYALDLLSSHEDEIIREALEIFESYRQVVTAADVLEKLDTQKATIISYSKCEVENNKILHVIQVEEQKQ